MKRSAQNVFIFTLVFTAFSLHAQKIDVGVIGGLNFADFNMTFVDNDDDYQVLTENYYGVGALFEFHLNSIFSIRLEPMYLLKGGVYSAEQQEDIRIKCQVLEIPLLFKAGYGEKIRPYAIVGPSFGYYLDSSAEADLLGLTLEGDVNEILKDKEWSVLFGAGAEMPIWKGTLFVEGRYVKGLTNMNEGGEFMLQSGSLMFPVDTDPGDELKTKNIQIMMGYKISL
jgi:hypothetical protein